MGILLRHIECRCTDIDGRDLGESQRTRQRDGDAASARAHIQNAQILAVAVFVDDEVDQLLGLRPRHQRVGCHFEPMPMKLSHSQDMLDGFLSLESGYDLLQFGREKRWHIVVGPQHQVDG